MYKVSLINLLFKNIVIFSAYLTNLPEDAFCCERESHQEKTRHATSVANTYIGPHSFFFGSIPNNWRIQEQNKIHDCVPFIDHCPLGSLHFWTKLRSIFLKHFLIGLYLFRFIIFYFSIMWMQSSSIQTVVVTHFMVFSNALMKEIPIYPGLTYVTATNIIGNHRVTVNVWE